MKLKTFRARLSPGDVQTIRLSTNDGLTGYKINKFEVMQQTPGVGDVELVFQVFTSKLDETGSIRTASATVDFNDPTLVGVAVHRQDPNNNSTADRTVIFDTMKFNQDIYITLADAMTAVVDGNYYLELEQVKLSKDEATVATLKDMRAGPDTNFGP
jgi:hypothetical protein